MRYFEKIEAYLSGDMNEMEQSIFEQTLAENTTLQKEYEAYKTAHSLFDFTAETLSEKEIITSEASETTEQLISFTAQNLSEQEILNNDKIVTTQRQAIVRPLQTRKNKVEWLVAASMLFILSLMGAQFYNNSAVETIHTPTKAVAKKVVEPKIATPIKEEVVVPVPIKPEPSTIIVKEVATQRPVPKYEPAKVKITPKRKSVVNANHIANVDKTISTELTSIIANPIASLTSAEKIVTGKVINKGESVVYKAGNSITLKPGFHAEAGASFVATSNTIEKVIVDLTKSEIIDNQQSTKYNATNSITLKPGFHAPAGSDFVAITTKSPMVPVLSTNMVVSEREEIVVQADKTVTLKAGFHAKSGAEFVAKVKK